MRVPARFLSRRCWGRRLSRRALAGVVALAGVALAVGMSAGASDRTARPAARTQAAATPAVVSVAAARVAYYRRTVSKQVSAEAVARFLPLYREAGRRFGVNWRLIASIHRQETAFSTAPSTYHGLNEFGCCAGPMQFNVTNGPVSTWERYRQAFRAGRRPKRYPHRTRSHPSVYDDFDAIMAAASLLSDSGASQSLGSGAWWAAYDYYGHDLFGVTYASQVLARAVAWQRDGFCSNCDLDEALVAEFENAYGISVRRQLLAGERRRKKDKRAKPGRDRRQRPVRRTGRDRGSDDRTPQRSPAGGRRRPGAPSAKIDDPLDPSPPRSEKKGRSTRPAQPAPVPTQPPPPTPSPPAGDCDPIRNLLGC